MYHFFQYGLSLEMLCLSMLEYRKIIIKENHAIKIHLH